jgi:hypothetical protein
MANDINAAFLMALPDRLSSGYTDNAKLLPP